MLRDPETYPDQEVLKKALGPSYPAFEALMGTVTGEDIGLTREWRYYRDGGGWLCKVTHKKITIFWLSVWEGFFRTTFYFTEKTRLGISDLDIDEALKEAFSRSESVGKLIPHTFTIEHKDQIGDVLKVASYKKGLK